MSIAIKPTAANQVRALRQKEPWLTPDELRHLTGYSLGTIRAALETKGRDKVKNTAPQAR